ncbi:probable 28S ribosomal protein S26, mitochondrial isoform X1 [Varroa jacobsoni]|uniref:Small ribosomal subunit protein mS26 n=2 Tax=Varroa TaxID=62624 RepID=A0A7M7MAA8_VARDE|nr:probable 28S ribosomal protein S26, mitochondrial [Varroa destructor]XP_022698946.1 probable 28S ribosomal protein S26, mitochondrial isoform X1 [Varroa jacobsoni]
MLRSVVTPAIEGLSLKAGLLSSVTQVRYKRIKLRKPAWMPRAPSKLYTIFKHPKVSEEEKAQYWALYVRYETEIRSIQAFFATEQARLEHEKSKFSQLSIQDEEDFQARLKANEEENKRVATERERRHREDFLQRMAVKMKRIEQIKEQEKLEEGIARQQLKEEMENMNYITYGTLDEAIKKAYYEPVSYNFAVTLSGKKIPEKARQQPHSEGH